MVLNSGPKARAQRWSRSCYDAYPDIGGIYYASSMNANQSCIALYERAEQILAPVPIFHRSLADPTLFVPVRNAAMALNYLLIADKDIQPS